MNSDSVELQETLMKSDDPVLQQVFLKKYDELQDCFTQLSSCFYKSLDLLEQLDRTILNLPDKQKLYTKYGQLKVENGILIGIKTVAELEELRNILRRQFPIYILL